MTANSITLDKLETRTLASALLASYVRSVRDSFFSPLAAKVLLSLLIHRLDQLKKPLRSGVLDKLSDDQLRELSALLKQLICSLLRVTESCTFDPQPIQQNIEDFESILENIHLALDPSFHNAVSSAINKLSLGVEAKERATVPR